MKRGLSISAYKVYTCGYIDIQPIHAHTHTHTQSYCECTSSSRCDHRGAVCREAQVKLCRQIKFAHPVCEHIKVRLSVSLHHSSTCTMTHVTHSSFYSSCKNSFVFFNQQPSGKVRLCHRQPCHVQRPSHYMTHYPEQPAWSSLLFHETASKAFAAGRSLVSVTDSHCSGEVSANMSRPAGLLQAELPCKCHTCERRDALVCFN